MTLSGLGYVLVRDFESTNGTCVEGKKVTGAKLRDGEKVVLGRRTILKYTLQDELEQRYHKEMYESSTRDSLADAFNRRCFAQKIVAGLSFARRHRVPFTLLFLDIDYFKKINGAHCHLTGDKVLIAVMQAIRGYNQNRRPAR